MHGVSDANIMSNTRGFLLDSSTYNKNFQPDSEIDDSDTKYEDKESLEKCNVGLCMPKGLGLYNAHVTFHSFI